MQTAYHAVTGTGLIVLHKLRVNTRFAVTLLIVRLYEIASRILEYPGLDNQQSLNRCFDNIHGLVKKACKFTTIFAYMQIKREKSPEMSDFSVVVGR